MVTAVPSKYDSNLAQSYIRPSHKHANPRPGLSSTAFLVGKQIGTDSDNSCPHAQLEYGSFRPFYRISPSPAPLKDDNTGN
jgi:hypothetical protein